MTRDERTNWIANIENTASFIESESGAETVNVVLETNEAQSLEPIASTDMYEVFSELYAIETNLRSG